MLHSRRIAYELLGLLYDAQDLCVPDFKLLNDGEEFGLRCLEVLTNVRPYTKLMDINGKYRFFSSEF
jgi:hypothetical protein